MFDNLYMFEYRRRRDTSSDLLEASINLKEEVGELPDQRLKWFLHQNCESLGKILLTINAATRGFNDDKIDFDGYGVTAGSIEPSFPPDQKDKILLLEILVNRAQQNAIKKMSSGESLQIIVNELAMVIPTVVNKLHLFADGNGRTSRTLRMIMREEKQITLEMIKRLLISKASAKKYDATPIVPVEWGIQNRLSIINQTSATVVINDIEDEYCFADEMHENIRYQFPEISAQVIRAYSDTANFNETTRLLAKSMNLTSVNISELLFKIEQDQHYLLRFTDIYSMVRKQRAEVLISALLGDPHVYLHNSTRTKDAIKLINKKRKQSGLTVIDPYYLSTVQDLQLFYCETFS